MATNTGTAVGYTYNHILLAAPTTTVVKSGTGILHTVTFNKPVATTVAIIYDGIDATNPIASVTVPSSPMPVTLTYDAAFTVGLTIVTTTAASDITVTYI